MPGLNIAEVNRPLQIEEEIGTDKDLSGRLLQGNRKGKIKQHLSK